MTGKMPIFTCVQVNLTYREYLYPISGLTRNGPRPLDVASPDELRGRGRHVQVAPLPLHHAAQVAGRHAAILPHAEPIVSGRVVPAAAAVVRRRRVLVVVTAAIHPLATRHLDLAER